MNVVTPNMFVRLSFDTGARTVGLVVDYAPNREQDGQTFVRVDWTPTVEGPHNILNLPTSILQPVCAWEDTFVDPDGTYHSMPCRFDAERHLTWTEDDGHKVSDAFCLDHSTIAVLDCHQRSIEHELRPLDPEAAIITD